MDTLQSGPAKLGHPFYEKLNELLAQNGFDRWVEDLCSNYFKDKGRRSIPPRVCFRMVMIGYFEGIMSERAIAWRCADSMSLRGFLGYGLQEATPDRSLEPDRVAASPPPFRRKRPKEGASGTATRPLGRSFISTGGACCLPDYPGVKRRDYADRRKALHGAGL